MYMDTNAYLGVVGNQLVGTQPLIGTLDAYNKLCLAQLQELWSNYGDLAEVWFDGGFNKTIQPNVTALFSMLQPGGVVFNGPGEPIGPQNALRWIGSERGYAPYPNWMTTFRNSGVPAVAGAGDPDGLIYAPSVCDTTLQDPTSTWLFDPFHAQPRNLSDLKLLYLLRTILNYVAIMPSNAYAYRIEMCVAYDMNHMRRCFTLLKLCVCIYVAITLSGADTTRALGDHVD